MQNLARNRAHRRAAKLDVEHEVLRARVAFADAGAGNADARLVVMNGGHARQLRGAALQAGVNGIGEPQLEPRRRMFVYLPYMHSEDLAVHEEAMPQFTAFGAEEFTKFELAHQDTLRRFGRYPYRNVPLGRPSTPEELEYIASGNGMPAHQTVTSIRSFPFPTAGVVPVDPSDSGIGMLSFGYSWASGFRLENEFSYTSHDIDSAGNGGAGSTSVMSSMFNLVYDIPLDDQWKISIFH